jgi:hypothetical protein
VALGGVSDDHGQGGLARAGRAPQDDGGKQPVGFDGAAQELAGAEDVFLADVLVQVARASGLPDAEFWLSTWIV